MQKNYDTCHVGVISSNVYFYVLALFNCWKFFWCKYNIFIQSLFSESRFHDQDDNFSNQELEYAC